MWSSWTESARVSLTQALEKTGDAISKAATNAGRSARSDATEREPSATTAHVDSTTQDTIQPDGTEKRQDLFHNIQAGWTSVIETTRASIKTAQDALDEQQSRLAERIQSARIAYKKRDPKLPLDVPALKHAEVVYVTDRIITMSHPATASSVDAEISGDRKLAAIAHLLQRRHDGRFMIWNLSEVEYDTKIFDDQVLTFSFPGSPSPPLGLLMKLLISMEAWLKADDRNVAVVHCLTGKGRTSLVVAVFLCWMGEACFSDINDALQYIASCKQIATEELTIPSQRRYASYFKNMLDGVRPSQPPLMLKRIILSEAPRFAMGPPREQLENESKKHGKANVDSNSLLMGCAPYLQLFKAGKLLFTAPASLHFQQSADQLPFCQVADGSISFHVNLVIQGDILVRCRHLTSKKQRISMFRAAFHTGYVPPNVLRLTKSQLDGACNDERFPPDFFIDLIFDQVEAEQASKIIKEGDPEEGSGIDASDNHGKTKAEGAITASSYDSMLHRDSRFWDVIAARRQEKAADETPADGDPMWGPTVGRRRDVVNKEGAPNTSAKNDLGNSNAGDKNSLDTFSIGGEFDFLPREADNAPSKDQVQLNVKPKNDSLMEALLGALGEKNDAETEEVVFFEEMASDASTSKADNSGPISNSTQEVKTEAINDRFENSAKDVHPNSSDSAEMDTLLADANLDLDTDVDAIFASSGQQVEGKGTNLDDLDLEDDTDLEDLENMLFQLKG